MNLKVSNTQAVLFEIMSKCLSASKPRKNENTYLVLNANPHIYILKCSFILPCYAYTFGLNVKILHKNRNNFLSYSVSLLSRNLLSRLVGSIIFLCFWTKIDIDFSLSYRFGLYQTFFKVSCKAASRND